MIQLNMQLDIHENKYDLVTIGEILVDLISDEYGENFESNTYSKYFGGSVANIAMNCRKLGIKSNVISSIGRDGLGEFLLNEIKSKSDLPVQYINKVEGSTSLVLVTKSKGSPKPIFYRDADYQLEYNDAIEELINKSTIIHFSTWPLTHKLSRQVVEKIINISQQRGKFIGMDPNYHPALWEGSQGGVNYIKNILKDVNVIKPSEDDARRLFGEDTPENQIDKFHNLGVDLVLMTLGAEGAIISDGQNKVYLKTMANDVVDVTGAGDAFWSGFYSALIKKYTVIEAVKVGLAVSAYKLKYTGAVVDLPDLKTIKKLYHL
ncbi:carbohydrate kinase family protein [Vallitalea okinawensis]|uniref:carbohydrate kinase family protein n=1 Tax=Vallitalea okinawensis TaxID=2078660 RepID=UPI000CFAB5F8|nr:PfkB family carbohydrate kinase [Vallitalea okinawensis]